MLPLRHNLRPILKPGLLFSPPVYQQLASLRTKLKLSKADLDSDLSHIPNLTIKPGIPKPEIRIYERTIARGNGGPQDVALQEAAIDKELASLKAQLDEMQADTSDMSIGDPQLDKELAQLRREIQGDFAARLYAEAGDAVDEDHLELLDRARPLGRRRPGRRVLTMKPELSSAIVDKHGRSLSGKQMLYLKRFHRAARIVASGHGHEDKPAELWKWYQLCKQVIPDFLESTSPTMWSCLWFPYLQQAGVETDSFDRIALLGKDMRLAGKPLSAKQLALYLQALFGRGGASQLQALQEWDEAAPSHGYEDPAAQELWNLGVLIHAASGQLLRAEEISLQYLNSGPEQDSRILTPLIYAYAESSDPEKGHRAIQLYQLLKDSVGGKLLPAEYESISTSFLNGNHPQYALAVFRDLMYSIDPRFRQKEVSPLPADGRIAHLVRRMRHYASHDAEANETILNETLALPRTYQNKYFFASWLKQLIASNNLEETGAVIELMSQRGIRPDARHLNGLIGAWLRKGDAASQQKAGELAWSMIQKRQQVVSARHNTGPIINPPALDSVSSTMKRRQIPPASIETFSVLAQYHLKHGRVEKIHELNERLYECEISPDTYFMNHVISALHRSGDNDGAWGYYQGMSTKGIQPDMATFIILWRCSKSYLSRTRRTPNSRLPSPRRLFAEMLDRSPGRKLNLTEADYILILQSFGFSSDSAGTLLVLHALRDAASLYPGEQASKVVVMQLMKLARPGQTLTRLELRDNYEKIVRQMGEKGKQRDEVFRSGSGAESAWNSEEIRKGEENLWLLSQVLRSAIKRQEGSLSNARSHCLQAAEEMGLGPMDIFDEA